MLRIHSYVYSQHESLVKIFSRVLLKDGWKFIFLLYRRFGVLYSFFSNSPLWNPYKFNCGIFFVSPKITWWHFYWFWTLRNWFFTNLIERLHTTSNFCWHFTGGYSSLKWSLDFWVHDEIVGGWLVDDIFPPVRCKKKKRSIDSPFCEILFICSVPSVRFETKFENNIQNSKNLLV